LLLWLLLFLAPPVPIAVYLLLLGALNRGRHPVLVPGTWDFAGVLFAASGFLLGGGPAILSLFNDRWRQTWLLNPSGPDAPNSPGSLFWLLLFFLYYALVVAAAVWLIRRQRRLTAVYNILPQTVEAVLVEVFDRLGLTPVRSGPLYFFGAAPAAAAATTGNKSAAIQAPRYPSELERAAAKPAELSGEEAGRASALEVEAFPALQHVTLCWDPADAPMRKEVENELAQRLRECPAPRNHLGAWMTVLGVSVLGITLTGGCAGAFLLLMAP
jgi:hypothetical protein